MSSQQRSSLIGLLALCALAGCAGPAQESRPHERIVLNLRPATYERYVLYMRTDITTHQRPNKVVRTVVNGTLDVVEREESGAFAYAVTVDSIRRTMPLGPMPLHYDAVDVEGVTLTERFDEQGHARTLRVAGGDETVRSEFVRGAQLRSGAMVFPPAAIPDDPSAEVVDEQTPNPAYRLERLDTFGVHRFVRMSIGGRPAAAEDSTSRLVGTTWIAVGDATTARTVGRVELAPHDEGGVDSPRVIAFESCIVPLGTDLSVIGCGDDRAPRLAPEMPTETDEATAMNGPTG